MRDSTFSPLKLPSVSTETSTGFGALLVACPGLALFNGIPQTLFLVDRLGYQKHPSRPTLVSHEYQMNKRLLNRFTTKRHARPKCARCREPIRIGRWCVHTRNSKLYHRTCFRQLFYSRHSVLKRAENQLPSIEEKAVEEDQKPV